ncbi:hypothetical protein K9M09_02110, partial [Patescibacteria group bacterium]|nr:hypothetical protein [Patescibacteria group bacterium]
MNSKATKKIVFKLRLGLLFFVIFTGFAFIFITITPAQAIVNNYNKATGDRLEATEWNALMQDFVTRNNGGDVMIGSYAINTATSSTYALDILGSFRASTITGSYTGTIVADNVSSGDFGSEAGGGDYSFPGKLGIGTTNPLTKIHSYLGASGATPYQVANTALTLEGSGRTTLQFLTPNTQDAYVMFGDPQSSNAGWVSYTHSNDLMRLRSTGSIDFYTTDTRMTIQQGGNVGIGLTNPAFKLAVNGAGAFGSASDGAVIQAAGAGFAEIIGVDNAGIAYNGLHLRTGASPAMTVLTSGNVGIGTSSPSQKLDVQGNISIASGNIYSPTTLNLYPSGSSVALQVQSDNVRVSTGHNFYVVDGNVGIGTTTPMSTLDVNGLIKMRNSTITANED